jgi:8-oxo-dGTP pyrophosphatase MutT (NUDIX family)
MTRRDHLHQLLLAHAPADATEARHRERMLSLLDVPGDPFARDHFGPGHFTASAFVLSPDGASLLLILHRKLGRWLQPGGHVDPDDADVIAAARREVAEETGLADVDADPRWPALLDLDVHAIPPHPRSGEPGHEHFDVRVLLRARTATLAAGEDVRDARWYRLDEIAAIETDESVLRAVRKLEGHSFQ